MTASDCKLHSVLCRADTDQFGKSFEAHVKAPADKPNGAAGGRFWVLHCVELGRILQIHQRQMDLNPGLLLKFRSKLVKLPSVASFLIELVKPRFGRGIAHPEQAAEHHDDCQRPGQVLVAAKILKPCAEELQNNASPARIAQEAQVVRGVTVCWMVEAASARVLPVRLPHQLGERAGGDQAIEELTVSRVCELGREGECEGQVVQSRRQFARGIQAALVHASLRIGSSLSAAGGPIPAVLLFQLTVAARSGTTSPIGIGLAQERGPVRYQPAPLLQQIAALVGGLDVLRVHQRRLGRHGRVIRRLCPRKVERKPCTVAPLWRAIQRWRQR